MNININFDDTYEVTALSLELTRFSFNSPTIAGDVVKIYVEIRKASNIFIHEFFNLAFGPGNEDNEIDDFATVVQNNYSKAFSTILLCALAYLRKNPDVYVGVDGSDFRRAYLYFRTLQRNYQYLIQYFRIFGLKYYVRVLRGRDKYDNLSVDTQEVTHVHS